MQPVQPSKDTRSRGFFQTSLVVRLGYGLLVLNVLCLVLGFAYLVFPTSHGVWNVFGVIMLLTMFGNLPYALANTQYCKRVKAGIGLLCWSSYGYTVVSIFAQVGMMLGTFLRSSMYSNLLKDTLLLDLVVYVSYFSIFTLGSFITYLRIWTERHPSAGEDKVCTRQEWIARMVKWPALVVAGCTLLLGCFFAYIILQGGSFHLIEVLVPEFALSYAFIFLGAAFVMGQWINLGQHRVLGYGALVLGLLILTICLLPIGAIPGAIRQAEQEFSAAFGSEWRSDQGEGYFRKTPFVLPAYFLGIPSEKYQVERDIIYYEGKGGVDQNVVLSFDAYTPLKSGGPGRATIIRIHGGAWITGDKGLQNMLQMNKYLASQGYSVFDIQYGLTTISTFDMSLSAPAEVKGEFNIDDMVRHIGIFLSYLADHAEEYGVNLDSVFISGGSAGGHLTAVVGLGLASGKFTDLLDSRIKVKGIIPFYPANGIPQNGGITGQPELLNPELLVEKNSPPVLIFQGTHDSLVPKGVSERFKKAYIAQGNSRSALILLPYAGHASDVNFAGYYNQVFLYYMERFMKMFQ